MMTAKQRWRRLRMGLMTLSGLRAQGYFIPYRYADQVTDPADAEGYPELEPWFAAARPAMADLLADIAGLGPRLLAIGQAPQTSAGAGPAARARWNQTWFTGLDAAVAYVLLCRRQPRRVVEVGSGHSTRFMARAIADGSLRTRLTAIDPAPRADIAGGAIDLRRQTVQQVDRQLLATLEPGDVLFIDSSHLAVAGSDVDLLLNRVLPGLPAGVLIHLHDILLPDAYPRAWGWRGYAEQLLVAPLIHGGGTEILFSSHYVRTRMGDQLPAVLGGLPIPAEARETSLWLEKITDGGRTARAAALMDRA